MGSLALRLEDSPPERESRRLEKNLSRLEQAVDAVAMSRDEVTMESERLTGALNAVSQGVVVCDENGDVVARNDVATVFEAIPYGDGPVGAIVESMLQRAIDGESAKRTLELFGPVRRTLVIAVDPIDDARRTVGGLAVIDEVSDRRRLDAVRRDFVANVSHELKTPVAALSLLADTLGDRGRPGRGQAPRAAHGR